jgi:hypothetical protein
VGVLQRFERRLEGLVQGAFSRAFGGWVEPVEVAAALTREAEDKKVLVAAGRVLVPNTYTVELARSDAELRKELGAMVAEAAQEQGWSFLGPVEVQFEEVDALTTGAFRVRSAAVAGEVAPPKAAATQEPGNATVEVAGRSIPVRASTVIGRGTEADVQIVDSGVSRRHAELRTVDERVELHDLGSTNGTRVNGQLVSAATLTDGDRITIGASELVFRSGR